MTNLISKCGMDCGACPWGPYPRENMTNEKFEQFRKRIKKILGYMPMQKPCLLCFTPDEKIPKGTRLPLRNCLVRRCVDKIGVENCAYCSRFPCDYVKQHSGQWNREYFEKKHGKPISDEDYLTFIEPFEGLKHLEAIRANLKPKDIVEAAKVQPFKTKIVDFPEELPFSKAETAVFKTLHQVLANIKRSSLGLMDTDTFAQQQRLKNRIPHFMRFLWILGRFGEFKRDNGPHLIVGAKTYLDNRGSEKTLATWSFVKDVILKILPKFGVHCERVAVEGVKEKDLTTPGGGLREKGWIMTMSFDESVGGVAALKALQTYTKKLDGKYGKRAFRHFADVDIRF